MKNETKIYNELRKQGVPLAILQPPKKRVIKAGNSEYDMETFDDQELLDFLQAFKEKAGAVDGIIYALETADNKSSLYDEMLVARNNLHDVVDAFENEKKYRKL